MNVKTIGIAGACLFAFAIIGLRLMTVSEPHHGDITLYALMGQGLLQGQDLYSDLWDNKLPGIYLLMALVQFIVGEGPGAIVFITIVCHLLTLTAILILLYVESGLIVALWGGACWVLLSGDVYTGANQPFIETVLNSFFSLAFASLCMSLRKSSEQLEWAAGILSALAILCKQSAGLWWAILGLGYIALTYRRTVENRGSVLQQMNRLFLPPVVMLLTTFAYFFLNHRWQDFWDATVVFNRFFAATSGHFSDHILSSFRPRQFPPILIPSLLFVIPALAFSLILPAITSGTQRRPWLLWACYVAGVHMAIALSGKFSPHYFQLWHPVLLMGAGLTLGHLFRQGKKTLAILAGMGVLILIAVRELPAYRWSPETWSSYKYGLEFVVTRSVGRDLKQLLKPEEGLYVWGTQYGLYYWSGHRPPTGVFDFYPLIIGPLKQSLTPRVLVDLEREKPELVILLSAPSYYSPEVYQNHPVWYWSMAHYRRFIWPGHEGSFQYFARKEGRLEKRIERGEVSAHFAKP